MRMRLGKVGIGGAVQVHVLEAPIAHGAASVSSLGMPPVLEHATAPQACRCSRQHEVQHGDSGRQG